MDAPTCTDDKSDSIQLTLYDDRGKIVIRIGIWLGGLNGLSIQESQTVLSIQVGIDNPEIKQVRTSLGIYTDREHHGIVSIQP